MKNFVCRNCGNTVKRPSAPLKCDACGQQRVGLFKSADGPSKPAMNIAPPPPPLDAAAAANISAPAARPQTPALPRPATSQPARPRLPSKPARCRSCHLPSSRPLAASGERSARAFATRLDRRRPAGIDVPSPVIGSTTMTMGRLFRLRAPPRPACAPVLRAALGGSFAGVRGRIDARARRPTPLTTATPGGPGSIAWRYPRAAGQGRVALTKPVRRRQGTHLCRCGSIVAGLVEEGGQLQVLWGPDGGHIPGSPSLGPDGRSAACTRTTANCTA
jgi:hypothetical protein